MFYLFQIKIIQLFLCIPVKNFKYVYETYKFISFGTIF